VEKFYTVDSRIAVAIGRMLFDYILIKYVHFHVCCCIYCRFVVTVCLPFLLFCVPLFTKPIVSEVIADVGISKICEKLASGDHGSVYYCERNQWC